MANKLLLCISVNGATAARWKGGRLHDVEVFTNDETGIAGFRDYAAASAGTPAFMIVDAVEEDYRFETLPHASGSDRNQMVERKLRQYYRSSPYCAASLIGRDNTKRRDDQFLFSALTNAEVVTPWLSVLTQCGLPVGGIYLLPMVISGLASTLGNKISNLLLVAVHPAGIRLAFFHNGTFRLSRLSRSDVSANNRAIIDEISNTQLYLNALRATSLDEPLTVVLLDHADQLQDMPDAIQADNPGINCSRLGRAEIASRLKLDPALIETSSATIYLQLLGARIPGNNLASPAATAGYRRYQSRRQLLAASAVAATIGVAGAGYNLWEYYWLRDRADDAVHQTARVDAEYQAATLQFPAAPTSADNMRTTTELAARLRATGITPERFLQVIVRALDASPEITLMELGWQNRTAEFEAGGSATGTIPPTPAVPTPGAGTGAARKQSGMVAGRVRDFKGDFRKAIASINVLAERLRQDPAVESVRFVQLPLNVSPTLALSGSTTDKPGQAGGAEFKLIVVLKQPT
jgi:hypothetical protein